MTPQELEQLSYLLLRYEADRDSSSPYYVPARMLEDVREAVDCELMRMHE